MNIRTTYKALLTVTSLIRKTVRRHAGQPAIGRSPRDSAGGGTSD
jgi:hypothetical protein